MNPTAKKIEKRLRRLLDLKRLALEVKQARLTEAGAVLLTGESVEHVVTRLIREAAESIQRLCHLVGVSNDKAADIERAALSPVCCSETRVWDAAGESGTLPTASLCGEVLFRGSDKVAKLGKLRPRYWWLDPNRPVPDKPPAAASLDR